MKKIILTITTLAITTFFTNAKAQNDFEIAKNVDIFISVLNELNDKYADEISPGTLTQTAIKAMLMSLDPYTVYYPESQVEDARIHQSGDYGDVDVSLAQIGDNVVVTELLQDGPSAAAGLRVGDRIVRINGQSTTNHSPEDVKMSMRGHPGTVCKVEIFRPTDKSTHQFNIKRQKISSPCVSYSGIIDNNVGYIKLTTFMEATASRDVFEAFQKLKTEGMKYLIIDIRDNGGGLLGEAVNIVNLFVDKDVKIVETKGKISDMNNVYKTHNQPVDKDIPIVILVNEHSASASEILSGSLQDLDRAVIVGRKTFGKGLVQKVYPMDYNTSMKITVSKYYIPSGRCVQNIEYFDSDTSKGSYQIPDSLAVAYKTKNNRTVYDKGGVEPDIKVDDVQYSEILNALIDSYAIFDFANIYHANHQSIDSPDKFAVSDAIYQDFLKYLKEINFSYKPAVEIAYEKLQELAKDENIYKELENSLLNLKNQIENTKKNDLTIHKDEISQYLAQEIVSRYYFANGKLINSLHHDADIDAAKKVLLDQNQYKNILSPVK